MYYTFQKASGGGRVLGPCSFFWVEYSVLSAICLSFFYVELLLAEIFYPPSYRVLTHPMLAPAPPGSSRINGVLSCLSWAPLVL